MRLKNTDKEGFVCTMVGFRDAYTGDFLGLELLCSDMPPITKDEHTYLMRVLGEFFTLRRQNGQQLTRVKCPTCNKPISELEEKSCQ